MSKSLIIAEKPSVASDLARALGGFKKQDDHFESDRYVLSSAIGHLVELALPTELDVKRGKWSFANLPIIPDKFELRPIEKTKARFNLLKRLMKREDVVELINACDAGREGELIFRYLVKSAGIKKPIRRLWLQSMTKESIREAFQHLRADQELIPLAQAAVCRSESDWLVGINGTRAMTAFNNKTGGFQLTPVGRVQTPTLAILTEREERIRMTLADSTEGICSSCALRCARGIKKMLRPMSPPKTSITCARVTLLVPLISMSSLDLTAVDGSAKSLPRMATKMPVRNAFGRQNRRKKSRRDVGKRWGSPRRNASRRRRLRPCFTI